MPKERSSTSGKSKRLEVASPEYGSRSKDSESPASDEGSGYKRKKTSSRHSEMPKIEEREVKKSKRSAEEKAEKKEKKERRATEGGGGSSRVEEGKRTKKEDKAKVRASDAGVYQQKQREGKEESNGKGKMRASDAGIYHRDDEGKKREDKGKGKARESLGGAPAADYVPNDAGSSYRLHEKVSPLMGEPKRLQELLEFAIEAEQKEVEAFYTGRNKFIADAFEEVASNFILESERATIAQIKKAANTIRPASATKKAEESPAKPNPVNIQRASEEKKLKEALMAFEAEEMEWHAVAEAASSQQQTTFQPLPSVSGPVPSSHCVMQELSIADRNIICSREGEELSELLAWTKGFVDSGMDRVRAAVSTVDERSKKCEAIHNRLVGTLRQATMAPYRGVDEPKKLLRSVIAGL